MTNINTYFLIFLGMLAGGGIVAAFVLWYLLTRYSFVADDGDDDDDGDGGNHDPADYWKHPRNRQSN